MSKTALITGVTGQDGSYLAEFLLSKGYVVHGVKRRASSLNTERVNHIYEAPGFHLHYGDLTDGLNLVQLIQKTKPNEIYNLGAQSHVHVSFETPEYTANADALGTLRLLEAIRILELEYKVRFYQASTSELFGDAAAPQDENTVFRPRSPYAVAKLYAYWIVRNYREAYEIHASNGILFNHESPRRAETFVSRKISRHVAAVHLGTAKTPLYLGNIDAVRDWGHAEDYVEAMWLMLQEDTPSDYVVATGVGHTVREFVEQAFAVINRRVRWIGTGVSEVGGDYHDGKILVQVDPKYFRPTEVPKLIGEPWKIQRLGWKHKKTFEMLVTDMVTADIAKESR